MQKMQQETIKAQQDFLVQADNVSFYQGPHQLLKDVTLTLYRQAIVTLIGPNGAGKSTFAKLIMGILLPSAGRIRKINNLQIGYVPQKLNISKNLPMNVRRLLALSADLKPDQWFEFAEKFGIADLLMRDVHHLSGGEWQRVLFARAIVKNPDLLVLDEPVQGVSFRDTALLYRWIENIRDEARTGILLISHDLNIVMAKSDYVVCLNKNIRCHGMPQNIIQDQNYHQLYGNDSLALYQHSDPFCVGHTLGVQDGKP